MFLEREQGGRMPGRGGDGEGMMRTASVTHTAATTLGRACMNQGMSWESRYGGSCPAAVQASGQHAI